MKITLRSLKNCIFAIFLLIYSSSYTYAQFREDTRNSETAFKSQKFDEAVSSAIKALMSKPDFEKAQEALTLALPALIRDFNTKISRLKETNSTFSGDNSVTDWQSIVMLYDFLVKTRDQIQNLPPVMAKKNKKVDFPIPDYYKDLQESKKTLLAMKESAAEQHYIAGDNLLKSAKPDESKQSAKEFKKSLFYVPNYKDAAEKYEVARKNAIKRIAIIPFENKSRKNQYGAIGEIITDEIVSGIMNNKVGSEFIEIITRDQLEKVLQEQNLASTGIINDNSAVQVGKLLGVSEILTGQITQITSTENPLSQRTYPEENIVNNYVTGQSVRYSAMVIEYHRQGKATISGSYKIIDVKTGQLKKTDTFNESYDFNCIWGKYSGDVEALSRASSALTATPETFVPSDEERVNSVSKKLSQSFVETLILYLK